MRMLAIDIGASSGRGLVGEFSGDGLSVSEVHRFDNGFVEKDGLRVWDLGALMKGVTGSIRDAGDIESLGIDTWGVDYGYVTSEGAVVGDVVSYRDPRTERAVPAVHEAVSRDELYAITGMQHMVINTVFQLASDLAIRPNVVKAADHMLMVPDLLTFLLTGDVAAEYTIASTTSMLDAASRRWSDEIAALIGFPSSLLPGIVMPGGEAVELTDEMASELGTSAKVIRVGSHDTASAVAAVPAEGGGWCYISSGTWSLVGCERAEPILTPAAQQANFTNEGGADGGIRFLRNVSGLWIIQELRRLWREETGVDMGWAEIVAEAEAAEPYTCLINPDAPMFVSPLDMRDAVAQNASSTGQAPPEDVGATARCVFESLAFAYRRAIEQMQQVTGDRVERIHVVGGGSQNEFLCQLTADACGVAVHAGPAEATALGNLLIQAIALGIIPDIAAGRELIATSFPTKLYEPSGASSDEAYERFLDVE